MVRKFKHHEQRLLKKVDFLEWKTNDNPREAHVVRRYHLQDRNDYMRYDRICGQVTKMAHALSRLSPEDTVRQEMAKQLLDKLYNLGIIHQRDSLDQLSRCTVSSLCRRRLAVVMMRLKMSETLKEASTFIEQGHVRVGTQVIQNPSFLVSRAMEDYVTWVDQSKIRRKIATYNDQLDDYELMN